MDPYLAFGHYPTRQLHPETRVSLTPSAGGALYDTLSAHPMYQYAAALLPPPELATSLLSAVQAPSSSINEVGARAGIDLPTCLLALSVLAKMGMVKFHPATPD
jgi:hypothetical protein